MSKRLPRYTGTTTELSPEANPTISLAGISQYTLGARVIIKPPNKKIQQLTSIVPLY
jgi:hypothetical protein